MTLAMGNSRKGTHCDKLVTTVCVLCILCAPHSHCSLHSPQLPKAFFHHHGQSKMGRPPDVTQDHAHDRNELLTIPKSEIVLAPSQNEPVFRRTSSLTKQDAKNFTESENASISPPHSRHYASNKNSVISSTSHDRPVDTQPVPASNDHLTVRSRRSGDHVITTLVNPLVELSPFVEEIFKEFGDGKSISMDGFKRMLFALGQKRHDGGVVNADRMQVDSDLDITTEERPPSEKTVPVSSCSQSELKDGKIPFRLPRNFSVPQHFNSVNFSSSQWHCLTGPEILSVTEVGSTDGSSEITLPEFVHRVCPALVYAVLSTADSRTQEMDPYPSSTHHSDHHSHDESEDQEIEPAYSLPSNDPKVWLYASLSVIVISLCGLLGVAVIPVMQKMFYQQLLQFLVALAVGTLCGDALIHLVPHAMAPLGHHDHHDHTSPTHQPEPAHEDHHNTNMWKGFGTMMGLVFFFTTEKCLTLVGDWRKRKQRRNKPIPSRVRVMREACTSSAVESGITGQVLTSGGDVILGLNSCGSSSPRLGVAASSNSVGEKLCKHKYSSYPYCYGEITTGEIVNETASAPVAEEKSVNQEKKSRQRRRQNGCSESVAESGDDKLEKLMVRDGSEGFVKSPIEGIGRGYPETHPKDTEGRDGAKEDEDEEEGGNSYTVILREHERPHHGHSHTHGHVHSAPESISSVAWMVIMGDGLHNLTDGMAIGAAFAAGIAGGFSTAVAVFCHELPHELGDFAVLLKAGMTAKQAVFYNVFSSLLCYFGMILGIFLGDTESASQWIFSAAAGMFLYIALVDMIPELTTSHSQEAGSFFQSVLQLLGLISGLGIMLLIALYEHDLKDIFRGEDLNPKSNGPE